MPHRALLARSRPSAVPAPARTVSRQGSPRTQATEPGNRARASWRKRKPGGLGAGPLAVLDPHVEGREGRVGELFECGVDPGVCLQLGLDAW